MKIAYATKDFRTETMATINQANRILTEYERQGYQLTLRQLYYQFVARDLLENSHRSYKNLGTTINNARLAGLIDWDHIEDRTRKIRKRYHWNSPKEIIAATAPNFHTDLWRGQDWRLEVWIEKDALAGLIEDICFEYDVPFFSCRGYTSQSEMHTAATRLNDLEDANYLTKILHLGDHDPSGMDMSRDIEDRLETFQCDTEVSRIALNMSQIEELKPPPNPAKLSDSRAKSYILEYGRSSWELDALEPSYINDLLEDEFNKHLDHTLFKQQKNIREEGRRKLALVSDRWDDIEDMLLDSEQ